VKSFGLWCFKSNKIWKLYCSCSFFSLRQINIQLHVDSQGKLGLVRFFLSDENYTVVKMVIKKHAASNLNMLLWIVYAADIDSLFHIWPKYNTTSTHNKQLWYIILTL
jgi:hypothetical protein